MVTVATNEQKVANEIEQRITDLEAEVAELEKQVGELKIERDKWKKAYVEEKDWKTQARGANDAYLEIIEKLIDKI